MLLMPLATAAGPASSYDGPAWKTRTLPPARTHTHRAMIAGHSRSSPTLTATLAPEDGPDALPASRDVPAPISDRDSTYVHVYKN